MKSLKKRGRKSKRTELITYKSAAELLNLQRSCCVLIASKATPGFAGGQGELLARGEVDKKKAPG